MAKKLYYVDINGLAEPIRYILHYGGQKFEDVKYELSWATSIISKWPIKNVKDSLPYGQLPLYQEGDKTLNQSLAIARYVAHQAKLVPTDPWEQAVVDAAVYNIYDFWTRIPPIIREKDPAKKEVMKKQILDESLDFYFSRFEKELKANNGFINKKLSWADIFLVGIVEGANLILGAEVEKNYPTIRALVQKIHALPGIKEYIAKREPYVI